MLAQSTSSSCEIEVPIASRTEDFYGPQAGHLSAAESSRTRIHSPKSGPSYELQYFDNKAQPKGTLISKIGNPTPLGLCAFTTTITSLSFFLMEFRGTEISHVLVGNFFFLAGLGLFIAGQWEIIIGNTFGFVVFCTFGGFYLSFGAIITPSFGVAEAYKDAQNQYFNGLALYLLGYCILIFVFMVASLRTNVVFVSTFVVALVTLGFLVASYFAAGDGDMETHRTLRKTGGACAFATGMLGWYLILAQLLEINDFDLKLPVGDLSHRWCKKKIAAQKLDQQQTIAAKQRREAAEGEANQ